MTEIERRCSYCGNAYLADLKKWGSQLSKFCSKTCANTSKAADRTYRKRGVPYKRMKGQLTNKE